MDKTFVKQSNTQVINQSLDTNPIEILNKIIAKLPAKKQKIIIKRFGLQSNSPLTLDKIGKEFHLTRERIRQIINATLKEIKIKTINF